MTTIDEFLQEVRLINWFEHSKEAENKYHVIHSIFEAYDDWNAQMLKHGSHILFRWSVRRLNKLAMRR